MLRLDDREWRVFSLTGKDGLFPIHATSTGIDGIRLKDGDDAVVPYITRTETNNGIARFIFIKNLEYGKDGGGCLTIGLDTQTAYWQPVDFATGQNIHILRSDKLNYYSYQFIAVILRQQMKSKFNWGGNGATLGRLKKLKIMLPVTDEGAPDYQFMEEYVRELMAEKRKQYRKFIEKRLESFELDDANGGGGGCCKGLTSRDWQSFIIKDIADVYSGHDIYAQERIDGNTPLVTAVGVNNGIGYFDGNNNDSRAESSISVVRNGASVGKAFYHKYSALYGNDCRRLKLKNTDSEFASLFITQVIRMQNKAFSYSRKLGTGRLENLKIMLPVTGSGEPDYDFMESFGRKMMSNKYHQYLAFNATPHANHHCKNVAVR